VHGGVQADRAEFMLSGVHAMRSARRSSRYSEFTLSGVQGGVQDGVHVIRSSSLQTEFNAECKRSACLQNGVQGGVQAEFSSACKAADQSGEAYAVLACSLQRCCYEGKMAVPKTLFTLELRLIRNVS